MICIIEGYHGLGVQQTVSGCDLCGAAVCADHRGLHWERAHKRDNEGFYSRKEEKRITTNEFVDGFCHECEYRGGDFEIIRRGLLQCPRCSLINRELGK